MRRRPFILAALSLALAAHADRPAPIRSLAVAWEGKAYVCEAVMHAPVRPAVAWDVLTDFEHMADWVPNLRMSRVVSRTGSVATVEQTGLAQFGFLSFNFSSERRMALASPHTIRSTQTRGNLRRYESLMRLTAEGAGTRLDFHVEIEPGPLVAAVLSREFVEHEIAEQFAAIIAEMVRRGS